MYRMGVIATAILLLAAGHPEADAAILDRSRLPPEQQQYAVYLSTVEVPAADRERLTNVLRFVVPSLSSKSYLADQLPQAVEGANLLRLDLQGLGWESAWAGVIAKHYVPVYRPDLAVAGSAGGYQAIPLVVSGAWFAAAITDPELTGDAQYQLLYSGKPPKNEKEFKAFWQVNDKADLNYGRIEGRSGVNVQSTRLLENHATAIRTYSWQTFDSRVAAGQTDPLENLTVRPPKHDASELIVGIPKHLGSSSGALHAFFLSDGKGNRQEKAPADIVTDDTLIRGVEIKNTIGCIGCHVEGLRLPNLDQYREYILSGARLYAKDRQVQREIDRYYDSPVAKEIARNNEDYAAGVQLCNGLTPQENALAFRGVVQAWDAPVTPEQQALEVYAASPEEWRLALGDYSRTYQLTGRLALAAQGQAVSRQQWEANYHLAQKVLDAWKSTTNH